MVSLPQRSFTSGELSPDLHARNDLAKYATGAALLENILILPYGGVSNRSGYQFCGEGYSDEFSLLVDFIASTDDTYCLEFSNFVMRIWRNGALVLYPPGHAEEGQIVEVASPYEWWELWNDDGTAQVKWEQSNDVMSLYHPHRYVRELKRFDHHDWTLTIRSFEPSIAFPLNMNVTATYKYTGSPETAGTEPKVHRYGVSTISEDGEESLLCDIDSATNLLGYDQNWNTITWNAVTGAEKYAVYKESNSAYGLLGYTTNLTFKDDNIAPDFSHGPRKGSNQFGSSIDDFPQVGVFYEQRQGYLSTVAEPSLLVFSRSSDFDNLDVSDPLRDDDAIEFRIAARSVQRILWAVAMNDLLVFTKATEWKISGAGGDVLTPSSIAAKPQSYYGCANVRPLVIGTDVLWVQRGGSVVRSTAFSFESDRYVATDRTVMAPHLFQGKQIIDWAFCQNPYYNVHCVTKDYALRTFTFMPEHDVWGWSRQSTSGRVGNMAAIPEGNEDTLYISVKRFVDGQWKHYIERSRPRGVQDVADGFFVDSGLSYDRPYSIESVEPGVNTLCHAPGHVLTPSVEIDIQGMRLRREGPDGIEERLIEGHHLTGNVTPDTFEIFDLNSELIDTSGWQPAESGVYRVCVDILSGLNHLEGRWVVAVGDGMVVRPCKVVGGDVLLDGTTAKMPTKAGRWHVGLPYVSRLQTLEMEPGQNTAMANSKSVVGVTLYLKDTRGIFVGPDFDHMDELPSRYQEEYQEAPRLITQPVDVEFGANWNKTARVCIEQRDPVPMTVLAVVPGLEYGGSR